VKGDLGWENGNNVGACLKGESKYEVGNSTAGGEENRRRSGGGRTWGFVNRVKLLKRGSF